MEHISSVFTRLGLLFAVALCACFCASDTTRGAPSPRFQRMPLVRDNQSSSDYTAHDFLNRYDGPATMVHRNISNLPFSAKAAIEASAAVADRGSPRPMRLALADDAVNLMGKTAPPAYADALPSPWGTGWFWLTASLGLTAFFCGGAFWQWGAMKRWSGERDAAFRQRLGVLEIEIERRKALECTLLAATQQAEAANQAKSDFLASMSHEIRTPLSAILGMAELLAESDLSARQKRYVDLFQHSGMILLRLINDILDLSKLEAGKLTLVPEAFDLPGALFQICAVFFPQAEGKGIPLFCDLAADLPKRAFGDPIRLTQIVGNLLSNACTFTSEGEIRLTASVLPADGPDDAFALRLSCRDTGLGISPEDIERVCDSFYQSESARRGGTGLGLSISKRLAALMQGTLVIESTPGRGTNVIVTVCLRRADDPQQPLPSDREGPDLPVPQNDGGPWRVLLADDSATNRQLVRLYLEGSPYAAQEVENGLEAVKRFADGDFHIVLMDLVMPVMDGLEATRRIRDQETAEGLPPTPIVGLTARAFPEDEAACLAAGCTVYMSKPVRKAALLATLRRLLGDAGADR